MGGEVGQWEDDGDEREADQVEQRRAPAAPPLVAKHEQ
jgi:hypothetical protein